MRAGGRAVDETCAVCLGPLAPEQATEQAAAVEDAAEEEEPGPDDRRMVLRCGHMFHRGCLGRWSQRDEHCPTCKQQMVLD